MTRNTILGALALLLLATPAMAETARTEGWRFQLTPYVWGLSVDSRVRTGAAALPRASVDQSFRDILRNLNGAFFMNGSVRYDRFVMLGDFSWSSSSDKRRFATPFGGAEVKGRLRHFSGTVTGGYTVIQEPRGTLDVLAGLRAWSIKLSARASVAGLSLSESRTEHWVDPLVALRGRVQIDPDWSLITSGDIGGAGVGSRLTWQLTGTVNYRVSDSFFLSAGYRHLYVDYRSGGMRVRSNFSGPLVGATFRF